MIISKPSITHKELQRDYSPESCIQILTELKTQTTNSLKSCFYFNTMQVQEPKFGFPVTESACLRHHVFTWFYSYGFGTTVTVCTNKICALWSKLPRMTPLLWHKLTHLV